MSFKVSVTENYLGGAKIDLKAWIFCANPWLFESENSVPLQLYKCQIFPFYIVCNMHQRQQRTGKFRLNKCPIYNMWTVVNLFLPFSALKGLLQRVLWKKTPLMTDFESSYKVLLFEKTLPCGNFWQHEGRPLNIWHFLQGRLFSLLSFLSPLRLLTAAKTLKWVISCYFAKRSFFKFVSVFHI